ncbi:MAG: NUDIX hydrolase [Candidatus Aenigmarchaeota archaeon]|nr:NUDIX hydrolase [Candidatus Aenigmarchaeota archaeon]
MRKQRNPIPTIDTIIEKNGKIVLVKRKNKPFEGKLALPGGFVELGETVEHAAVREAFEETGLRVKLKEILGVYSHPKRNPLLHTLTVVFIADPTSGKVRADSDVSEAKWFELKDIDFKNLAFDHAKILKDYMNWKKKKGTYWSGKE